MKKSTLMIMAAGVAAYFLFVKKGSAEIGSAAYSGVVDDLKVAGNKQSTTNSGTQSSLNAEFMQAVNAFGNAPVNTTKSISAGIDVINTAVAADIQLPRTSQTLVSPTKTSTGTSGGIAKLASGSVVSITIKQALQNLIKS
jgi:hypothetical protein